VSNRNYEPRPRYPFVVGPVVRAFDAVINLPAAPLRIAPSLSAQPRNGTIWITPIWRVSAGNSK